MEFNQRKIMIRTRIIHSCKIVDLRILRLEP